MDDRDALLTIGRFAELTGLTVKALRLYDRLGLLTPAAVDFPSGYRYYAETQVDRGRLIRFLRRLDLPLTDVHALLHASPEEAGKILERHRARLRGEIEARRRIVRQIPTAEEWIRRKEGKMTQSQKTYICSFCGKPAEEIKRMIAGPKGVFICNECIGLCNKIIAEEEAKGETSGAAT